MKMLKYTYPEGSSYLGLPGGSHARHVGLQGGEIRVWAEVPDVSTGEDPRVVCVPTGCTVPADGRHIGTVVMHHGSLVFHFYEVPG